MKIRAVLLAPALLVSGNPVAVGQCEIAKLLDSAGHFQGRHGTSVAMTANEVLVGSTWADGLSYGTGSVLVYQDQGDGWKEVQRLFASDGIYTEQFGWSLALSGSRLLVGAPGRSRIFVFERGASGWTEVALLTRGDTPPFLTGYGRAVALDGNFAMIGADSDDDAGTNAGAVYVYEDTAAGWVETQKLTVGDAADYDRFGATVAVSANTLLVGSPSDDDLGTQSGSAYVFENQSGTWVEVQKLLPSDGSPYDEFGQVVVDGSRALIGSFFDDDLGRDSGSVYYFERMGSSWIERDKLLPAAGKERDHFGSAIALIGTEALIGANANQYYEDGIGSAHWYQYDGIRWIERTTLVPAETVVDDLFGAAVAFFGDRAVVGAPADEDLDQDCGAAHLFSIQGVSCPRLLGIPYFIRRSLGGKQFFTLRLGAGEAGQVYFVLGSASGSSPGFTYGGFTVPLNPDWYFLWTFEHPNQSPLSGTLAVLDPAGTGSASLMIPRDLPASVVGLTLHHAAIVFDPATLTLRAVSEAVDLTILP